MTITMPLWFAVLCFLLGLADIIHMAVCIIVGICIWIDRWSRHRAWEKCHRAAFEYECQRIRGAGSKLFLIDSDTNF